MVQFLLSVVISLIFIIQATNGEVDKYNCEIVKNVSLLEAFDTGYYLEDFFITNACVLKGLNLTSTKKHFKPVTNYSVNEIDAVYFRNSKLEILTDDVCETFPLVKFFIALDLSLTSVDENAFSKCTTLDIVNLRYNFFTTLPPKIFYRNEQLTHVYLADNELTSIDVNLFKYNKKLTVVNLSYNNFRFLPTNIFKNLLNLRVLDVSSNQLSDLSFLEQMPTSKSLSRIDLDHNYLSNVDVENLHKKFPSLKTLWLHENEFWCDRQTKSIKYLEENKIEAYAWGGFCIENRDAWETNQKLRQTQFDAVIQDINKGVDVKGEISGLKYDFTSLINNNNDRIKDEQRIIFTVLVILIVIVIILLCAVGWMMKKLLNKPVMPEKPMPKINVYTTIPSVSYHEYEYVPGFNQAAVNIYDHLQFNQN